MLDITRYRDGMAMLAGAVNVITTDGPQGKAGFTATAVCSVTDQPPTLLVCMNRASYAHPFFTGNGVLCVNLLSSELRELSGVFANREITMEQRFARTEHTPLATGSQALAGALVNFDCRIVQIHDVGSHSIFFCEVVDILQSEAKPALVYFNRSYHPVGTVAEAA